ncbi:MAG: FAD binding domain-containing protein [Actinomycetia bacterium]|nr:FAD binding domain-containing protein [Actinomycetes bacterium]
MKPPAFEWVAPDSLEACLAELIDSDGDVRVIAGGQSLIPLLNLRFARPLRLVDINPRDELAAITTAATATGYEVRIGATVRHQGVLEDAALNDVCPVFAQAAIEIGHLAIRNRGTFVGAVAHADPHGEWPAVALALSGVVSAQSAERGERAIPAAEYYLGPYSTSLETDEMVTAVAFQIPRDQSAACCEVSPRRGDFAQAGAVAALSATDGQVRSARVALFGEATGLRSLSVESLVGASLAELDPRAWDSVSIRLCAGAAAGANQRLVEHVVACALADAAGQRARAAAKEEQ